MRPYPRRPLTEIEQARHCVLCGARPGERCTSPNGINYAGGVHGARKYAASPAAPSTQREQVSAYFRMLIKLAETAEGERLEDLFNRIERTIAFAEELEKAAAA